MLGEGYEAVGHIWSGVNMRKVVGELVLYNESG